MKKIALTTVVVVLILSISTITALAAGNGYGKGAADVSGTPVSELKPDTPANNAVCPRNENCSNGALCLSTGLCLYKSDCPNDGIAPRDGTGRKKRQWRATGGYGYYSNDGKRQFHRRHTGCRASERCGNESL